jgi:ribonuclease E
MKKEMLINVLQPEECRIAIVEDGVLEELYVERTSHESYTGNIYKGKIVNLEPAIQAAFVDFSVGRNGFLHVSDVEPQYYFRHEAESAPRDRDPRRDRPEPRRPRPDDRDSGGPQPSRGEDRPRERDRPDRSEKGRRDRSTPRRFGEGLLGEEELAPLPPPPPPPPPLPPPVRPAEPMRDEPRRPRPEPAPSRADEAPFGQLPDRERDVRPPGEPEAPMGRAFRGPEPFDPDLPPSRTHRGRSQPPAARAFEPGTEDAETGRSALPASPFAPEPPPEPPTARDRDRDPRRGRGGRGRPARPMSEPGSLFEPEVVDVEPEPEAPELITPEPDFEDRPEPPRRRGGRAAIRSRGGEREPAVERPRERERLAPPPLPEPEIERPRPVDRERERERERPRALEPERARGFEPEPPPPPRERERERERERKVHDRAGEPGYVPRRERARPNEPGFGVEPPPSPVDWVDAGPEIEPDIENELDDETGVDEATGLPGKLEGPRRRRRRRGRRRERERPGVAGEPGSPAGDLDADLDEDEIETVSPRVAETLKRIGKPLPSEDDLAREFDFGDESEADLDRDRVRDRYEEDDEEDDDLQGEGEEIAVRTPEDDQIDPGLEEEIRREVEEIAELEREMGLRGTTEARPRRGDDREAEPGGRGAGGRFTRGRGMVKPPIQEIFRRGDEVLIQVIKESIGTKGPTLSTYISIPGRYLVLMPGLNRVGVSRKIADEGQRRKLREIMNDLNPPKGLGFIVRTAGLERTKRELARDLAYLLRLWKVILRRIKNAKAPAPIYQESDMITRTIRDIFTSEIDTIWIDEPAAFERAQEFLRVVMPKFVNRLKLYDERVPLFHKYGIEDEIAKIQRRHVPLPEGGSIVIDQTEALVAIDVNSGNFRVENDAERTAYEMNLRAAKEIARQLRLRDLGGVIVNDFIDMREERHRRGVEKALRDAIKRDRARTKVLRMSAFGLIEMTRQRIRPSLKRSVYEDCSNCTGAGVVKTVESMSIDVMRLLALASHREDIRRVNVSVSTPVATYLNNRKRRDVTRLETEFNMTIHIRPEENVPAEHLQIECFDGNNGEIRLLPAPPTNQRRPHAH